MQFGGFSGLCIRIVAFVIARSSKFALDNSMVKKLYSAEGDEATVDGQRQDANETMRSNDIEGLDKSEDMMKALSKRSVFSYKYIREAFLRRMSSWYCCFCCKPKLQRRDRLFKDARSKLFEEIDILEIIKKLRVNKFTSEVILKPR